MSAAYPAHALLCHLLEGAEPCPWDVIGGSGERTNTPPHGAQVARCWVSGKSGSRQVRRAVPDHGVCCECAAGSSSDPGVRLWGC